MRIGEFPEYLPRLCLVAAVGLFVGTLVATQEAPFDGQIGTLACAGSIALLASAIASRERKA